MGCLSVLDCCGFAFDTLTWICAAEHGQVHCLQFAANQNYDLNYRLVRATMRSGRLACMEFLIQQGRLYFMYLHVDYPLTPDQLKCLEPGSRAGTGQWGCAPSQKPRHGGWARRRGLRLRPHKRGWPLWQEIHYQITTSGRRCTVVGPEALVIHPQPHYKEALFKAMRYGSLHGAPVTRPLKKHFRWKQQRTHALLCCFKAAARLTQRAGAAGALASMGAVPTEVVELIVVLADLEIPEIVMKPVAQKLGPGCAQ